MRTMEQKTLEVNRARPQTLEENPARSTAYPPAALLQSFSGLFDLNGVLNEFTRQWHTLHGDLDSILSSIDLRSRELDAQGAMDPPASPPSAKVMDRGEELLSICESTSGKNLRKFVISHLSDVVWLRREVPAAIACAPDPAKLVFGSLGRFYLQGRRAYDRPSDDPMVVFRRACILILEFYVLSGCTSMELEESIEQNAEMAALSWRSRLINEGGLQAASAVDALGLVLFVGSFGIPQVFGCRDLYELLRSSNLKKKADVLRNSAILCQKMPGANSTNVTDIINEMLSKEMNVEAVELICAFELKEKHPPVPLIVSYLQKIAQPAKGQRKEGQSFVKSQREANEKQLEKLKLIVRYCEDYKLDPSQLASFNFNQKIAKLETQISKDDERLKNKRKAQEMSRDQVTSYWRSTANQSHVVTPHFGAGKEVAVAATAGNSTAFTEGNTSHQFANYNGGFYGPHGNGTHEERALRQNLLVPARSEAWMDPTAPVGQNAYNSQALSARYATRSSGASLYHFADDVLERESYYANRILSNPTSSVPNQSYYPSYIS
ncbi:protein FRIGIDA-like isoform X3 [Zingiber officinale]|uniref:protein FRIGIDA-like isoform X3 n=1 Tax=Zingiber officinale TaxID=94328 RepID=UPI001C4A8C30|nr:protein FRIGIDA-like isoform X3 [Zingiber officinale]